MVGQHTEAKYPVLIFKLQLATCVEKIYGIIRDNLKREVGLLLDLCIAVVELRFILTYNAVLENTFLILFE